MDWKTLKLIEDKLKLLESPAIRAMQEVAAKIDVDRLHTFAIQAQQFKRFEEIFRTLSSINFNRIHSQALEAIKRFDSIDKRVLEDAQRAISFTQSNWLSVQAALNSPAFAALDSVLFRTEVLHKSFLSDIAEKVWRIAEQVEIDAQDQTINDLRESIIEKSKQLPAGRISFEGMLNLVFTLIALLITIITYREGQQNDEHIQQQLRDLTNRIGRLPEEIVPQLAPLLQGRADSVSYIVERQCSIFTKPFTKSAFVSTVYPNQRVQLIQRKHKWIYIQYFDYLDGVPKNGWVLKKYLKIVAR